MLETGTADQLKPATFLEGMEGSVQVNHSSMLMRSSKNYEIKREISMITKSLRKIILAPRMLEKLE